MTLSPIDPSRSERDLLAGVFRWARRNDWHPRWPERRREHLWTWVNASWPYGGRPPEDATRVVLDGRSLQVEHFKGRTGWRPTSTWKPASVVQAVDVLVALGVLPPLWSSSYALAVERYSEQIETLEADLDRKDGYLRSADDTIAGLIEENRELRRAAAVTQLSAVGGEAA